MRIPLAERSSCLSRCALTVVLTTAIVVANMFSDIALGVLDPRIRDG
jgi:ABC-type dipeptide/oligopeptide/nickel transport system permease component